MSGEAAPEYKARRGHPVAVCRVHRATYADPPHTKEWTEWSMQTVVRATREGKVTHIEDTVTFRNREVRASGSTEVRRSEVIVAVNNPEYHEAAHALGLLRKTYDSLDELKRALAGQRERMR